MRPVFIFISLVISLSAFADDAEPWGNSVPLAQVEPIQDLFWNEALENDGGPDRQLPSGIMFEFSGGITRDVGGELTADGWIKELKNGLGPAKMASAFHAVQTVGEVEKFLASIGVRLEHSGSLRRRLDDFIHTRPVKGFTSPTGTVGQSTHPVFIVGKSREDAIILFGSSNDKYQSATILKFTFPGKGSPESSLGNS